MNDHISYSQIECFKCPGKYKNIYLDKSIKKESQYMTAGRVAHDAIRNYSVRCIQSKVESDYDFMNEEASKAINVEGLGTEEALEVRESLLEFAEKNLNYDIVLDYEKKFDIPINEGIVEGIIDRTNGYRDAVGNRCLDIIDYKYSYKNYTESEVDNSLQLRIYRWAGLTFIYKNYDLVRLGIYNIRYNFCRYGKEKNMSELSKELEAIENMLNEEWNKIKKAKEYPYIKSAECFSYGGCPVMISGACPMYSEDEINNLLNSNDIASQVRAIRKLKVDLNIAISKVKKYFDTNKPIVVDGDIVGYLVSNSYKYLLSGLIKLDKKYNLPIGSLTLSKTEVEKILKKKFGKEFMLYIEEIKDDMIRTSSNKFEI